MRARYAWAKTKASPKDSKTELASSFSVDGRYDVIMVPSLKIVTAITFLGTRSLFLWPGRTHA